MTITGSCPDNGPNFRQGTAFLSLFVWRWSVTTKRPAKLQKIITTVRNRTGNGAEKVRFDYVSTTCRLRLVYVSFTCFWRVWLLKYNWFWGKIKLSIESVVYLINGKIIEKIARKSDFFCIYEKTVTLPIPAISFLLLMAPISIKAILPMSVTFFIPSKTVMSIVANRPIAEISFIHHQRHSSYPYTCHDDAISPWFSHLPSK